MVYIGVCVSFVGDMGCMSFADFISFLLVLELFLCVVYIEPIVDSS